MTHQPHPNDFWSTAEHVLFEASRTERISRASRRGSREERTEESRLFCHQLPEGRRRTDENEAKSSDFPSEVLSESEFNDNEAQGAPYGGPEVSTELFTQEELDSMLRSGQAVSAEGGPWQEEPSSPDAAQMRRAKRHGSGFSKSGSSWNVNSWMIGRLRTLLSDKSEEVDEAERMADAMFSIEDTHPELYNAMFSIDPPLTDEVAYLQLCVWCFMSPSVWAEKRRHELRLSLHPDTFWMLELVGGFVTTHVQRVKALEMMLEREKAVVQRAPKSERFAPLWLLLERYDFLRILVRN